MQFKHLLLSLFAVSLVTNANASSLDEVKPIDEDQAIRLRVIAPDSRVLPSPQDRSPSVNVYKKDGTRLATIYSHKGDLKSLQEAQAPLAAGEDYRVVYTLPYSGSSGYHVRLITSKMDKSLVTHTIPMKRIDVHHITVTRPDGTTYIVKGQFKLAKLKLAENDEEVQLGTYPTGNGLDVPTGFRYRVIVSGVSEDGPTQYKAELDFTK